MSGTDNRLADLAARIRTAHEAATRSAQDAMERSLECGRWLLEARAWLPSDMTWENWVAANLPFGRRQAERYVRLARYEPQIPAATSQSHLNTAARFNLEKTLAAIAVPLPDREVRDEPGDDSGCADAGSDRQGVGSTSELLRILENLNRFDINPEQLVKSARNPERLLDVAAPAYETLRLLRNALDKRLKADGKRPAQAAQPLSFLGKGPLSFLGKGMLQ
jgi:Protein of unknown function (DUF3102)